MTFSEGGSTHSVLTVVCHRSVSAVLRLVVLSWARAHLMGVVYGAPLPRTLSGVHVMYKLPWSTDIIIFVGGCGGGTGLRVNDDGR